MTSFPSRLRRFVAETSGSLSVEMVLALPFLLWAWAGTYTFFDAYQARSINLKATYTIGDLLSRDNTSVDQGYIDGMAEVYDFLTYSPDAPELRITVIKCIALEARLEVVWSATSGGRVKIDNPTLSTIADHIPAMADGDQAIIVESWMDYDPLINVGISERTLNNIIITRPRAPQLPWHGGDSALGNGANSGVDCSGGIV